MRALSMVLPPICPYAYAYAYAYAHALCPMPYALCPMPSPTSVRVPPASLC